MANAITLSPSDGLRNTSIYPDDPGSDAAAREQIQSVIDQVIMQSNTSFNNITSNLIIGSLEGSARAISDANLATENGLYYIASNGSNIPSVAATIVWVGKINSSYIFQIAVNLNASLYVRVMSGGIWGAWAVK